MRLRWACAALAISMLPCPAAATPLLANGDFEQGLTGWSRAGILYFGIGGVQQQSPFSEWGSYDDPADPGYDVPQGILAAGGTNMATYYADGPVLGILYQGFTVAEPGATVTVSFDFHSSMGAATDWPCGFDGECMAAHPLPYPDDLFRVDLVRGNADPFSTAPGEHLTLLDGSDDFVFPNLPYPYLHAEFDVSAFVAGGGDFLLRFAGYGGGVVHVDDASVEHVVPEPSTGALIAIALGAVLAVGRSRAG